MLVIPDDGWKRLEPLLKQTFPRLTPGDYADCDHRVDLLIGKVQNRHWIARDQAQRQVLALVRQAGLIPA
jgi:hypothetical protein